MSPPPCRCRELEDLMDALHLLAFEMLEDGDVYVKHYGQSLTDLLKLAPVRR